MVASAATLLPFQRHSREIQIMCIQILQYNEVLNKIHLHIEKIWLHKMYRPFIGMFDLINCRVCAVMRNWIVV